MNDLESKPSSDFTTIMEAGGKPFIFERFIKKFL